MSASTPDPPERQSLIGNERPKWLTAALRELQDHHLRRFPTTREGKQGAKITIDGRACLNFGANDYLNLAADPRLAEAAIKSIADYGWGSAASPLVSGRSRAHAALEEELAEFERSEAALLFPTGFAANVGVITALAGRGDLIFSDAKNHASIIDGCRLSGARIEVYRHGDVAHLRDLLAALIGSPGRRMIVTDGLFSMDGDLAPLPELSVIAAEADATLVVDEAHATGIWGAGGRGTCEFFGIENGIAGDATRLVRVGTLSKALGSVGGFVAGTADLVAWIANKARAYIFSTALPPACCEAAREALRIVQGEPLRRHELLARARRLHAELGQRGWKVGDTASQILPIRIGDPQTTMALAKSLWEQGIFVPGIRPPSVPEGESLLRISLSHAHSNAHLASLLCALEATSGIGCVGKWPAEGSG